MRLAWVSKAVLLVILKYVVLIVSTIVFYHVFFAPFHTFSPSKHVFRRSIDVKWPKHLKTLLSFPSSLQLAFIDKPTLTCITDEDQTKKSQACQQLRSDEVTRIGTFLSPAEFKQMFSNTILNHNVDTKDTWHFDDKIGSDTLVLRYHYNENFDKHIIVSSLVMNKSMNYYVIRGARNLKTIGIRHFTNTTVDLTASVGVSNCEAVCQIIVPEELHRHMLYLTAGTILDCDHKLAAINVKKNATWAIPRQALDVLDQLIDNYLESNQMPFLCHGTMLGWYRDCGIIPHTTDLDLCIKAEEYVEDFHTNFIKHKTHPPSRVIGKGDYGLELTYWLIHNVKGYKTSYVDIFYMYKENATHSWTPLLMDFSKGSRVKDYVARVDQLCTADIYGHLYFVTCSPLAYLETRYGEKWNVSNSHAGYFEKGVQYEPNGNWNLKKDEFYKSYK